MLNSSVDVLNRFSAYPFAFLTDILEPYRSVDTGPRTNSCRRFYWYEDPANESNAVELMLKVMTFGDRPAANILAQSVNMEVSAELADFICGGFFVDDGGTSSMDKEKMERMCKDLPRAFNKYSFHIKHVLKSYEASKGITNTDSIEIVLGLVWNFNLDRLLPALNVFLCKKRHGEHQVSTI